MLMNWIRACICLHVVVVVFRLVVRSLLKPFDQAKRDIYADIWGDLERTRRWS